MRHAYTIVEMFEEELAEFCGSRYAVAVDSCTNAIFLSLLYEKDRRVDWGYVRIPRHTYPGVVQAAKNAGLEVRWSDDEWQGEYFLPPLSVIDAAKRFERGMYTHRGYLQCVSFHIAKLLPLGHGGAILTDDEAAYRWLYAAKMDGRVKGETGEGATRVQVPGYHMMMTPDDAARGLWLLNSLEIPANASWEHYPNCEELFT